MEGDASRPAEGIAKSEALALLRPEREPFDNRSGKSGWAPKSEERRQDTLGHPPRPEGLLHLVQIRVFANWLFVFGIRLIKTKICRSKEEIEDGQTVFRCCKKCQPGHRRYPSRVVEHIFD